MSDLCFTPVIQSATVYNFVFDRIRSVMARANDNSTQCLSILVFLHHPVVLSRAGLFAAYLAAKVWAAESLAMS